MKILVTGAGALLGQGIIKSLRVTSLNPEIIAVDPDPLSAGLYWADSSYTIPMANASNYMDRVKEILLVEKPDAILVGTDVELPLFSSYREQLEKDFETCVLVSDPNVVAIADNKWLTYKFLKEHGFDCPESCLPGDEETLIEKVGFPLVVKPLVGARSIGVMIVKDKHEIQQALKCQQNVIIQECVGNPDSEYTAGVLYFKDTCNVSIVMRRELRDGNTYRAFVDDYPSLNQKIRLMAEKLKPYGPLNFQFRLENDRIKVFEINARFSGTTPLRAHAGFNEVEMALHYLLDGKPIIQPKIQPMNIVRHWSETIIRPDAMKKIAQ